MKNKIKSNIKIKDSVNLDWLENYGFDITYSKAEYMCNAEFDGLYYSIRVDTKTREVNTYVCTGDIDCCVNSDFLIDKIIQLISAGFIEKAGD